MPCIRVRQRLLVLSAAMFVAVSGAQPAAARQLESWSGTAASFSTAPPAARSLPVPMQESGRWFIHHGKTTWATPLALSVTTTGRVRAHAASVGPCIADNGISVRFPGCVSAAKNANSDLCMSSLGGRDNQKVEQELCNGSNNQTWWLYDSQGYWFLWNKGSDSSSSPNSAEGNGGYCLDDNSDNDANGTGLIMYQCTAGNQAAKHWNGYATNPEPDFEIRHNDTTNTCVSTDGNNYVNAQLVMYSCNHSGNQAFASVTLANDNGGGW